MCHDRPHGTDDDHHRAHSRRGTATPHPLIESHRQPLLELARRQGIGDVRVFGSMARGDAGESRDVDPLVTSPAAVGAPAPGGLLIEAHDLPGRPVDGVTESALHRASRVARARIGPLRGAMKPRAAPTSSACRPPVTSMIAPVTWTAAAHQACVRAQSRVFRHKDSAAQMVITHDSLVPWRRDSGTVQQPAGSKVQEHRAGGSTQLAAIARRNRVGQLEVPPPGNRLEALGADRKGQHSILINDPRRICFEWRKDGAYRVEIVDYHWVQKWLDCSMKSTPARSCWRTS